jgi:cytochrome P450
MADADRHARAVTIAVGGSDRGSDHWNEAVAARRPDHDRAGMHPSSASADATERHGEGPSDAGAITLTALDADPYPLYRTLRDEGVVWVEALGRWMVSRWSDVELVETAREDFSATETDSNLTRVIGHQMLRSDGAAHKRLRAAAQDPLRPRAVEERTHVFQRIADELLDEIVERGEGDLVRQFAAPFAARCLTQVLGLPTVTGEEVEFWSQSIMAGASNYGDDPDVWATAKRAMDQVEAAIDAVLDGDGPEPGSILHAMATSDGQGRPLERAELYANVKVMIGGGFNEPRDAVSTGLLGLLGQRDQLDLVLRDPSLWPRVGEEAVRWIAPIGVAPREVRQRRHLSGADLEPGARVLVNFASANRDERAWERPDAFDISRPKRRNVAFGVGHHYCLGVWMARAQLSTVAMPTLFRRLPGLRLDDDRPVDVRGWVFRGPVTLHARWDA